MVTTKIYRNTTDKDINVVGVGVIPAGEQVSLTSENHQPVILENFPGIVDATLVDEVPAEAPATTVSAVDDTTKGTVQ